MTMPSVPTAKMSSGVGSLVLAFFCAARKMSLPRAIAASSAVIDRSRPTKSCDTMCGKTMMSRSGSSGADPALRAGHLPSAFVVVLEEHPHVTVRC